MHPLDSLLAQFPDLRHGRTLLAVSGGQDSVVMAHLFWQSGLDFAIAHANFGLRGTESDDDAAFVRALSEQYAVPFHTKSFETSLYAKSNGLGIQEAARHLRYAWFETLLDNEGYPLLATAHHLDDSAETLLFHLVRGTGWNGLRGIPSSGKRLLRPLSEVPKSALAAYAEAEGLRWREDSSNQSDKYTRNFLRNKVLPLLREINPQFDQTMRGNLQRFRDTAFLLEEALQFWREKVVQETDDRRYLNVALLREHPARKSLLHHFLSDVLSSEQCAEAEALLDAQTGTYLQNATHRLTRDRAHLILARREQYLTGASFFWEESQSRLDFTDGTLLGECLSEMPENAEHSVDTVFLPIAQLRFPLELRPWQHGDRFRPFGMNGHSQKLSDFLGNIKMPLPDKQHVWVLCSGKDICWVVGLRSDERFRVGESAGLLLRLRVAWLHRPMLNRNRKAKS